MAIKAHTVREIIALEEQEMEFLDTLDIESIYDTCVNRDKYRLYDLATYINETYSQDYIKWQEENYKFHDSEIFSVLGMNWDFADYLNDRYGQNTVVEIAEPEFMLSFA